jgi:hypothetical protein
VTAAPADAPVRRYPPIAQLAVLSFACVVVGGILMASYAPRRPPLAAPVTMAAVSAALLLSSVFLLSRLSDFAWSRFFTVARWTLLAYLVMAGMIAFAFIHDHVRGAPLTVILLMLVIFALDVPLIVAFTVARYSSSPYAEN